MFKLYRKDLEEKVIITQSNASSTLLNSSDAQQMNNKNLEESIRHSDLERRKIID